MTFKFFAMMLVLFGASIALILLSLRHLRASNLDQDKISTPGRVFLIALRLAIGWHCLVEGMEKVSSPSWSSEAYLRESVGPFSGIFRWVAGDRLIDKLTVGADGAFPSRLDRDWRAYVNAFTAKYDLSAEQIDLVKGILDQREKDTLEYLSTRRDEATKVSAYPPSVTLYWTMPERLEEHERLLNKVREAEAEFPSDKPEVLAKWKRAKDDLTKWRGDLKKSLDGQTDILKQAIAEKTKNAVIPDLPRLPMSSWRLLEWSDFFVRWCLVLFGIALMLGIFTRQACFATAGLILSFYAAMPPLPGWPESPRLEGHYVLINKTLIEVLALFALAWIPTGRWAGLDGIIQFYWEGEKGTPLPTAQRNDAPVPVPAETAVVQPSLPQAVEK